ncbi:hypothetical protein [Methanococcoides seepicolus]|uniref:Uncharacterized protein n=1 Tax=Methanococcoides seepicolus TaxID=2828780 RepID=A0A9E4ZED3_9EURY|nr:hypothetical protein [Methanococcoides seepicolus]MCM1986167.1 hypothetical protein [Methanococcoides seepicolus]
MEDIRQSVLDILNDGRDTLLQYDADGVLSYDHDDSGMEDQAVDDYVPIREFVPYGMLQRESLEAWLASIPDLDNRYYCEGLIDLYCEIQENKDLPSKMKRLYVADLPKPPATFKIISRFVEGGKL